MKNIIKYLFFIFPFYMASCSSEDLYNEDALQEEGEITKIEATVSSFDAEDAETRISISMGNWPNFGDVLWAEGDTIGIYPSKGDQVSFPIVEGVGTKFCEFNGGGWALKTSSSYTAYTPFNRNYYQYMKNDALPVSMLGQKQVGNNSSAHVGAYDLQIATGTTPSSGKISFSFQHQVSFVRMDLTAPNAATWKSVTLESNATFTTNATMNLSSETPSLTATAQSNSVTLELENVKTTADNLSIVAYMMLLPVNFTGKTLDVKLTDVDGNVYTAPATIANNKYNFGAASARWISAGNFIKQSEGIYVEIPGTLSALISESNKAAMTSLTVSGYLNESDMVLIRSMILNGSLKEIYMPDAEIVQSTQGSNTLRANMFAGCTKLEKIVMPKYLYYIGNYVFQNCTNLTYVVMPEIISGWMDSYIFAGCTKLTSIILPDIDNLRVGNFMGCTNLEEVVLPNNCTIIGNDVFSGCVNLASIELPTSLASIGNRAFEGCVRLNNLEFPISLSTIGTYAFKDCTSLSEISFPEGVINIQDGTFSGCSSLLSVIFPKGLMAIGDYAFSDCSSLVSIDIPNNIITIEGGIFYGCNSLKELFCEAVEPPTLLNFGDCAIENIYVPMTSVDTYKLANGWSEYESMIEGHLFE